MNMPTPPQEASQERRRRQNRESQRRWRERYRQEKAENKKKSQDTPSNDDETVLSRTPSVPGVPSPQQSNPTPDSQQLGNYFVENNNVVQDQLAGSLNTHISWPTEGFNFHIPQQAERSVWNQREGSTSGYQNGSDVASVHASPECIASQRLSAQFSHLPPGICRPTPFTTPAESCSAGSTVVSQSVFSDAQCGDTETAPTAEEAIRDVELLYRIGVKAGFLKRDDKVKHYLSAMRRTYHRVPTLLDEDFEAQSGSDLDEWSD